MNDSCVSRGADHGRGKVKSGVTNPSLGRLFPCGRRRWQWALASGKERLESAVCAALQFQDEQGSETDRLLKRSEKHLKLSGRQNVAVDHREGGIVHCGPSLARKVRRLQKVVYDRQRVDFWLGGS